AELRQRDSNPTYTTGGIEDSARTHTTLMKQARDRECVLLAPLPHTLEDLFVQPRVPDEDVLGPVHDGSVADGRVEKPGAGHQGRCRLMALAAPGPIYAGSSPSSDTSADW